MTQINQLEENLNVASVSERSIQSTAEFNIMAVRENMEGKGPQQIFKEAGFDLTMIGKRKASLNHWYQTFLKDGKESLWNDERGKAMESGLPNTDEPVKKRLAKQRNT